MLGHIVGSVVQYGFENSCKKIMKSSLSSENILHYAMPACTVSASILHEVSELVTDHVILPLAMSYRSAGANSNFLVDEENANLKNGNSINNYDFNWSVVAGGVVGSLLVSKILEFKECHYSVVSLGSVVGSLVAGEIVAHSHII